MNKSSGGVLACSDPSPEGTAAILLMRNLYSHTYKKERRMAVSWAKGKRDTVSSRHLELQAHKEKGALWVAGMEGGTRMSVPLTPAGDTLKMVRKLNLVMYTFPHV